MELLYKDTSWGAIELNYELNPDKLLKYYTEFQETFSHCYFNFNDPVYHDRLKIEVSKEYMELGYCGYYCGDIGGYTLAWPTERYEPLPPSSQANIDMFPETLDPIFYDKCNVLPKYRFGLMQEMLEVLGEESFKQCIISTHGPGAKILTHKDSDAKKLHIPLITNEDAFFTFGKEREVKYNLKVGKIYILNTNSYHGTENNGKSDRAHFITRIDESIIQDVVAL
ncbi:uncharacterized protein METZ01_LOCUS37765 [marine metagenome]|uniref:Aspartyl/asparaginy/proline hydroxylase domain-containing protein n=1 Tax=marine metagenome TaxID=408172 RepID=A0A381QZN5_9ZZZZ